MGQLVDNEGLDNVAPVNWLYYVSADAQGRFGYYGISATPTIVCDGSPIGGYDYGSQYGAYLNRHTVSSPCTVTFLANSYSGSHACVKIRVTLTGNVTEGNVVYMILWEDKVSSGPTWRFVERNMGGYQVLLITQSGQSQDFSKTYTLDGLWNTANLGCTVIVQKLVTHEIFNAGAKKLVAGDAVNPSSLGRVKALFN